MPGKIVGATVSDFTAYLESSTKPVVVNFWASWCTPCRDELPVIAAEAAARDDVQFLGIDVRDDPKTAAEFIKKFNLDYPHLADPDGRIQADQRVAGLPVTRFYHSDGTLAFMHAGEITAPQLREKLAELLKYQP